MIEDFLHLSPVSTNTGWCTLSCEYLREFSKKFETALMVYSGAWGKWIHEKNQKYVVLGVLCAAEAGLLCVHHRLSP
jgi:hypothetical protein